MEQFVVTGVSDFLDHSCSGTPESFWGKLWKHLASHLYYYFPRYYNKIPYKSKLRARKVYFV